MNKPSYVLAIFTVIFGGALIALRSDPEDLDRGSNRRAVVRHTNQLPDNRVVPEVHVHGRVFDRLGWPVGNTQIAVRSAVDQEPVSAGEADAAGVFRLQLTDNTPVDLTFRAPGHADEVVRVFPARRGPIFVTLGPQLPWNESNTLEPWRAGELAGEAYVKDPDGSLLADAEVVVCETGLTARSDENGRFRIGLPDGPCRLLVRHGERAVAEMELPAPTQRQGLMPLRNVVVEPGLVMEGMVTTPAGDGAVGVPVHVQGQGVDTWTLTGEGGAFRVAGMLPGVYRVVAAAFEGALGLGEEIALAADTSLVQLRMRDERPIDLHVVRDGEGLPRVHVLCREEGGLRTAHAQADENGYVQLRGLAHVEPRFEVRKDQDWTVLPVVAFEPSASRLVVAAEDD